MSLYSSAMGTSATSAASSIISRVILLFSAAMAHSTSGSTVVASPTVEQTTKKSLRFSMRCLPAMGMAGYYRVEGGRLGGLPAGWSPAAGIPGSGQVGEEHQ